MNTDPAESRPDIDFGDLLVAVADSLDEIRQCLGCGADSTWAALFVHENGLVNVTAWCDAAACEHDRTELSKGSCLAFPIDHLPSLRRPRVAAIGERCHQCGPGYRIGDDGCRHGAAARGVDALIPTVAACGRPHPGDCALVDGVCLQPLTPPHRPPPLPDPVIPDTGPDPRRPR